MLGGGLGVSLGVRGFQCGLHGQPDNLLANQTIYFHLFGGRGKCGYVPGACDEGERHSAARISEGIGDENAKQQNHG